MFKKKLFIALIAASAILVAGIAPYFGRVYALPQAQVPTPNTRSSAGNNLVGNNFVIRNEGLTEVSPAVAYNPDRQEYLAVWYNDRPGNDDIQAQRVSKDGKLVGGAFFISAGGDGINRRYPDVTYNTKQKQYLVVWEHDDAANGYSIRGRRVLDTGQVVDASDIVIRGDSNLYTPVKPAVAYAYTADKYLVVWAETWHPMPISTGIVGQVVQSSGALDGGDFNISQDPGGSPRNEPDVAYNRARNEYLVAWQQENSGDFNIYARRVTRDGLPLATRIH